MKKAIKFFVAALLTGMCSFGYAQTQVNYMKPPKLEEKVIGTVSGQWWIYHNDDRSKQEVYEKLLAKAKEQYQGIDVDIRGMNCKYLSYDSTPPYYKYEGSGKVVNLHDMETLINAVLSKALRNVREGSRLAIDRVTVTGSMDREILKDQLIDVLLDKGYKIVAKEYLERLYEEQQNQQSGIYNERTTVQGDNFSGVGYYIYVKVTETSLRVQVVNVSTGEYEGNATVNF